MPWYFHPCCLHAKVVTALENKNYLCAVHEWKHGPVHLLCQEMPSWEGCGHGWSKRRSGFRLDTWEHNFAVVPQLCGQTDSGLAENSVLITIVFPSYLLKNLNARTGVDGASVMEGTSLLPTQGSGVWVDNKQIKGNVCFGDIQLQRFSIMQK